MNFLEEKGRAKTKRDLVDHQTASDKRLQVNGKEDFRTVQGLIIQNGTDLDKFDQVSDIANTT